MMLHLTGTDLLLYDTAGARAGHAMAASGPSALMCGGYSTQTAMTTNFSSVENGLIDCWWLTPRPVARWDRLKVNGTDGPTAREGHTMEYDAVLKKILLFGGKDWQRQIRNDCWFIDVNGLDSSKLFTYAHSWTSCIHDPAYTLAPVGRYGHGSIFFEAELSLYIYGGFLSFGSGETVSDELWKLTEYHVKPQWDQVRSPTASSILSFRNKTDVSVQGSVLKKNSTIPGTELWQYRAMPVPCQVLTYASKMPGTALCLSYNTQY